MSDANSGFARVTGVVQIMAANSGDPWFHLMVGQWWTPESDLATVGATATKRQMTSTAWQHFSGQLRQQMSGSLSPEIQKGVTADNLRQAFTWGADQADDVAKTNSVISDAHGSAHRSVSELNSRLKTIAHDGKSEINQIQESKDLAPVKLGKIVEVVMRCQQDANAAAAPSTQNIFEAMQNVLDQRGIDMSARQFAQQQGIDTTRMLGSPNKEAVTEQVKGILGQSGPPQAPGPKTAPGQPMPAVGGGAENVAPQPPATALGEPAGGDPPLQAVGTGFQNAGPSLQPAQQSLATGRPLPPVGPGIQGPPPAPPAPPPTGGPALPGPAAPTGLPAASSSPLPTTAMPTSSAAPAVSTGPPPNAFMHGFEQGLASSAPVPSGPNAAPAVMGPVQPQVPAGPAISDIPASTVPSAAHAPVFEAPPATSDTAITSAHTSVTDSGTTYLAGPAAAAAPPAATRRCPQARCRRTAPISDRRLPRCHRRPRRPHHPRPRRRRRR